MAVSLPVDPLAPADRFPWERIMPRNEWEQVIRGLPATSPLFEHRGCGSQCRRRDGSRLSPATLKHVALTLATYATPQGRNAWPGINRLAYSCSRHRGTVIAALGHLERVGLISCSARAGTMGRPREHANIYCLTSPQLMQLAAAGADEAPEVARAYEWFKERDDGASTNGTGALPRLPPGARP